MVDACPQLDPFVEAAAVLLPVGLGDFAEAPGVASDALGGLRPQLVEAGRQDDRSIRLRSGPCGPWQVAGPRWYGGRRSTRPGGHALRVRCIGSTVLRA